MSLWRKNADEAALQSITLEVAIRCKAFEIDNRRSVTDVELYQRLREASAKHGVAVSREQRVIVKVAVEAILVEGEFIQHILQARVDGKRLDASQVIPEMVKVIEGMVTEFKNR